MSTTAGGPATAGAGGDERATVPKAGPADLIATVWFRLGYRPSRSLVVVALHGARQRAGLILRADLPPVAQPEGSPLLLEFAISLLSTVGASGATAVLGLVIEPEALRRPVSPLVTALRAAADGLGLRLVDVLGVGERAFGSLICPDLRCCPPVGEPLAAVLSSRGAVAHVVAGHTLVDSEAELVADLFPAGSPVEPAADPAPGPAPRAAISPADRASWWWRWLRLCAAAPGARLAADDAGLSAAMYDPGLRDAVLAHLLGAEAEPAGPDGAGPDLEALMLRAPGDIGEHPGRAVLAAAVRSAGPGERAPALAVLAFVGWFEGQGGLARLLVERARDDEPSLTLTRLVADLLSMRVPPPWLAAAWSRGAASEI